MAKYKAGVLPNESPAFDGVSHAKETRPMYRNETDHVICPVLFLDFDLVLNDQAHLDTIDAYRRPRQNELTYTKYHELALQKERVERLNRALDGINVGIVFSTSWRWMFEASELMAMLARLGLRRHILGVTPKRGENFTHVLQPPQGPAPAPPR